ncbi:MAG: isopentenyl-diphosphate Delta-isomerase [Sphingobacteriales bacterium]|jgi:isopentenyl-diphosphate delta-isomerase|nr:isopentenyl-diphosphate Delta-isomerase [Sphingobacteriales bacterium]
MMQEMVILVDEHDNEIGLMEKQEAHVKALLHRAFSVMVFNDKGEMLLQQRALSKYHSGGLWTNTCCSHPRQGETTEQAAHRRLQEEMGFDCELKLHQTFIYKAPFDNGLTEHELDHVFIGTYNQDPHINPEEVNDFHWISLSELDQQLRNQPEKFTVWFKMIMDNYVRL